MWMLLLEQCVGQGRCRGIPGSILTCIPMWLLLAPAFALLWPTGRAWASDFGSLAFIYCLSYIGLFMCWVGIYCCACLLLQVFTVIYETANVGSNVCDHEMHKKRRIEGGPTHRSIWNYNAKEIYATLNFANRTPSMSRHCQVNSSVHEILQQSPEKYILI